jgi:hypothetical protein
MSVSSGLGPLQQIGQIVLILGERKVAIDIVQVPNILDHEADIHRDPGMIRESLAERLVDSRMPLSPVDLTSGPEEQPDVIGPLVPGP